MFPLPSECHECAQHSQDHKGTPGRVLGARGMAEHRWGKPSSIGILATSSDRMDPFLRAAGALLPQ